MSLTLPYPSLVFVPLDTLEAQDLNKVVANYEYISNQFPITASNIDLTTFEYKEDTFGSGGTNPGAYVQVYTYTVQNTGLFYVMGNVAIHSDSANGAGFFEVAVDRGGSRLTQFVQRLNQIQSGASNAGTNCIPSSVLRLQAGDVITWEISGSAPYGTTAYYWDGGTITVAQLA